MSYPLFYSFYTQMTAGASVRIGILLNFQMIQLYSVCCLTMKLAMVINDFVAWCDRSYLCLNATKTKDMCIDFRKYPPSQSDTVIHDNKVEVVDEYKYLGTTIDNKLKWDRHCIVTYKKCQQRLNCLRKLRSFNIDNTILSMFYKSCIQSVLTFSFICWFVNVSQKDKNKLQRVVNISSKITGLKQTSVTALYEKQILRKANKIINDSNHILYNEYVLLPSSRRFRTIISKTNRKRDSFTQMSVRLLNSKRQSTSDVMCLRCVLFLLIFLLHNYNYNFNFKIIL